jgi:MFS transporter, AAHS family, 4-hydroxybenzoate transporter
VSGFSRTLARTPRFPIARLFADGRAVATILLWLVNFLNVLNAYFISSWLPTIGQPALSLSTLFVVAFMAGLGIFAGQPGLNAFAATVYPTDMRSTEIGSGLGIGRFGAFLGPILAGELMRRHWSSQDLFHAAAIPAALSALAILSVRWARGDTGGTLE